MLLVHSDSLHLFPVVEFSSMFCFLCDAASFMLHSIHVFFISFESSCHALCNERARFWLYVMV